MAEQGARDVVTVVVTADNHLGYGEADRYGRVGARFTRAQERLRRLRSAFQQATDFAVGQRVDFFIQAGDLFDTPDPTEQERGFVAARLAELRQAGVRCFAVGGIHDTPRDTGVYRDTGEGEQVAGELGMAPQVSYARLGAVHYFPPLGGAGHGGAVELEPVLVEVHGVLVAVCGLGVGAGEGGDPLAKVRVGGDVERADVALLVLHAPIEGLGAQRYGFAGDAGARVARSTIAGQSSFRAILAGYHHAYRRVAIGGCDVIVAGATQHVDFDDADGDAGFVFLGLAADGVRWCQHIAVDTLRLRRLVIDVAELGRSFPFPSLRASAHVAQEDKGGAWEEKGTVAQGDEGAINRGPTMREDEGAIRSWLTDAILERLRPLCAADNVVQLRLVGELSRERYHQLDLGRIRDYGEEHCFELVLDEGDLSLLPMDGPGGDGTAPLVGGGGGGDGMWGGLRSSPIRQASSGAISTQDMAGGAEGLIRAPIPVRSSGLKADFAEAVGARSFTRAQDDRVSAQDDITPRLAGITALVGERLSPREELVNVADEWIAAADDEQEKKALIATKEELLAALDRMKRRSA